MKLPSFVLLLLLLGTLAVQSHAQEAEATAETTETASAETASADAGEAVSAESQERGVAERLRHKDRPVSLMDQPLDGSSVESFNAGLAKLDEEVSEEEYRSTRSAISFLLFYDIGAGRDKAKLYKRLNGKTPNEIIARVEKHRNVKEN